MSSFLPKSLLRIAIPVVVLAAVYAYAEYSIAATLGQAHHGDVGLGLALLIGFAVSAMLVGYGVDLLVRLIRREWLLAVVDLAVIAVLAIPFGWVGCNWFGMTDTAICRVPLDAFGWVLERVGL